MKRQNWVALVGLVAALLAALVGQVGAAGGDAVAPGFRPGTSLEASKENSTSKANSPGGSAVVAGAFGDPAASRSGSGVVGWLKDHGKGLLYGVAVGAAVAVGVVVVGALVTLSAPVIAVAAVGALVAGGLYGLFTGAARFNVWEAVVYSSIGAVSAGVGQGLAALSLAGRGLMAARAGIDVLGGGLATTASYLLHEAHPTWGGAATAFGLGAVTAGVFMGLGFGFGKVLAKVKTALAFRGGLSAARPVMAGGAPTLAEGIAPTVGQGAAQAEVAVTAERAVVERLGVVEAPATRPKPKLTPGTPEHKLMRWQDYQARSGMWSYDRWSKQYDTNMRNATYGLAREAQYRDAFGGESNMLRVIGPDGQPGYRQVDIYRESESYAGQLKTGRQSLTSENIEAIRRDAFLVSRGVQVEWILEKGGSRQLLEALDKAGVDVHVGRKIP